MAIHNPPLDDDFDYSDEWKEIEADDLEERALD